MKVPALRSLLLLLLVSAMAGGAAAQTATVSVAPAAPTTDDVVVLTLAGQWPDACAPGTAVPASVTRQSNRVNVLFSYAGFSGACATVITPWSTQISLGKLAAGSYQVEVALSHGLAPAQSLGSAAFSVTAPQTVHVYVPSFLSSGEVTISSRLHAFNNGSGNASVELVAAYDAYGRHDLSGSSQPLSPGASAGVATENVTAGNVRFVEVAATTHVALRAALERSVRGVSQGRIGLPVFPALHAAGSTVVAGDVRLGSGFRRANLTLFNAGTAAATVHVEATSETGAALLSRTVTVSAQSTQQLNALLAAADVAAGGASAAWIRITADQPFLAYASAIYDETAPGTIPYEIFPARPEL